MENINPQNWPRPDNLNQQSSGTPPPPPPPPPEITLRTMQSDIETMKQSGGEEPVGRPFTPPELKKEEKVDLSGFSKESKEEIPAETAQEPSPKNNKWILWVILVIIILGGFTALGYYVIFPALFPSEVETPAAPPQQTPAAIPPVEQPAAVPEVPLATTTIPTIPEAPSVKPHQSLFITAADSQAEFKLSTAAPVTLETVKQVLVGEADNKPTAETAVKEIIFSGDNGQLNFAEVFPLFLTNFTTATLSKYFEEDFTSFIYYDKNGQWFGLAAKLKTGADIAAAKTEMAKLEKSSDLENLYLVSPGAKSSAGFKVGQVGAMATRYIAFSKTGASLNYGWTSNNLFVISVSYNGIKTAVQKLGQ